MKIKNILKFNQNLAENYKNNSQKIRVMSEDWTDKNIFCPNCGNKIFSQKNNKPVSDFFCKKCLENFELKSSKIKFSSIPAGSYLKYIESIKSNKKPNYFLLNYLVNTYSVNNFFTIPKHFIIPEIIKKRNKSLKDRKNYYLCNILFSKIPDLAKIYYIKNEEFFSKKDILKNWKKILFFKKIKKIENKGWILDILNCVESLNKKNFKLEEIYKFEKDLKFLHPKNNNIKAKIRQQLQFLRNKNIIKFIKKGEYKLL